MDCFVCSNLVDKQYYIFNKPHTKEQYEQFMSEVDLGSYKVVQKIKEKYNEVTNDLIVKEFNGVNNQNTFGNYISNCKDCYFCFECSDCEELSYCTCIEEAKTGMDWDYWGQGSEQMYECIACGYENFNLRFCNLCWEGSADLTYCDHMFSSKNCFGCVGLKKAQYCIFNKQYTKEEYENLSKKIIEHMNSTGEWGEFFPASQSIYAYPETIANEQEPLTKEEILKREYIYKDINKDKSLKGEKYKIPDKIKDVAEDIVGKVLSSEKTGDQYKIIPQEFKFLKENGIPIPRYTPDERHYERQKRRNPRKLWDRKCDKCKIDIRTSYSPERSEKVYCEQCYLKEVY